MQEYGKGHAGVLEKLMQGYGKGHAGVREKVMQGYHLFSIAKEAVYHNRLKPATPKRKLYPVSFESTCGVTQYEAYGSQKGRHMVSGNTADGVWQCSTWCLAIQHTVSGNTTHGVWKYNTSCLAIQQTVSGNTTQ
ncbi:hypothetical protein Btru_067638 [Bulinus truncatus]|nr:hypothetical protein Btru_067638 [Bulinus truncatus]